MIKQISGIVLCLFFLISCTVKPPQFIVKGIKKKSAISFLEEFQKGQKSKEEFNHHIESLRSKSVPGFSWDEYWSEVKNKKLYDNLKPEELVQLLSLSDMSCYQDSQDSFARLLLQMAESDPQKMLFHQYLRYLKTSCSTSFSDDSLKSIVLFLSEKRNAHELTKLTQAKKNDKSAVSSTTEKLDQYIYTEELYKLLTTEWFEKRDRNWNDILSVVNRNFYSDVRWINYQKENWQAVRKILQMEWDTFHFIMHLDKDIFYMFEKKNKMADIINQAGYKTYFSTQEAILWSSLWEDILISYPDKPDNSNVETLLSLYSFSCKKEDLASYSLLVEGWGLSDHGMLAVKSCMGIAETIALGIEEGNGNTLSSLLSHVTYKSFNKFFARRSSIGNLPVVRQLLSLYAKDQYRRPVSEWKKYMDEFSESEWLAIMRDFRISKDSVSISQVLDMYSRVYDGRIPFLAKDIMVVLFSEGGSVSSMIDYGYHKTYLNSSDTLREFWVEMESTVKPAAVTEEEPSAAVIEEPSAAVTEEEPSAAVTEEEPSAAVTEEPSAAVIEEPSAAVIEEPSAAVTEEEPSAAVTEEPSAAVTEEEPSAAVTEEEPSAAVTKQRDIDLTKPYFGRCDYSYISSLWNFFSRFNKQGILFNWFSFENCLDFISEFKAREWNSLIQELRLNSDKAVSNDRVWWIAHILSLPSYFSDSRAVSELTLFEWERIIGVMSQSINQPSFAGNRNLFKDTVLKVAGVYPLLSAVLDNESLKTDNINVAHYILSFYSQNKYLKSSEEWVVFIEKYLSEEEWLGLMRDYRSRLDKESIGRVLDMHYQVYGGKIPFLVQDIMSVFMSGSVSVLDLTSKYGYSRDYINDPQVLRQFWEEVKKAVNEKGVSDITHLETRNVDKCDYSYVSNLLRFFSESGKEELLFDQFNFENCATFITEFRQKEWSKWVAEVKTINIIEKAHILTRSKRADSMLDIWWMVRLLLLYSEDSVKTAVSMLSAEEWESLAGRMILSLESAESQTNQDLFSAVMGKVQLVYPHVTGLSVKEDPKEKNLKLADQLLSLYATEKNSRSSEQWKEHLSYFSEEEWLDLMRDYRSRLDKESIGRVLDMHYQVYGGKIPFLVQDIMSVFMSETVSVSDLTFRYGYSRDYINDPQILRQFWEEVKKAVNEKGVSDITHLETRNVDKCDYSYVSNLLRFFSESGKEELLFDQFNFENCATFITEFRQKEWNKLVHQIKENRKSEHTDLKLLWWAGRVLSLPSSFFLPIPNSLNQQLNVQKAFFSTAKVPVEQSSLVVRAQNIFTTEHTDSVFVKDAVSLLSAEEWEQIIVDMIASLRVSEFSDYSRLFKEIISAVRSVYSLAPARSVCRVLSQRDSHFFIQKYSPELILDLLGRVEVWSQFQPENKRLRRKNWNYVCFKMVPRPKINMLLFVLSSFFV